MDTIQDLEELSEELEDIKKQIDSTPEKNTGFESFMKEKRLTGFRGGGITDRRNEMRSLLKKAGNSNNQKILDFRSELIVSRYRKYIEVAQEYIELTSKHRIHNQSWFVYYFDYSQNRRIVKFGIGILITNSDSACELTICYVNSSKANERFEGAFKYNTKKGIIQFDLCHDEEKTINIISTIKRHDNLFSPGTYNKFDGTRIECGRILLKRASKSEVKPFLRNYGMNPNDLEFPSQVYSYLKTREHSYVRGYDKSLPNADNIWHYPTDLYLSNELRFVEPSLPVVLIYSDLTFDAKNGIDDKVASSIYNFCKKLQKNEDSDHKIRAYVTTDYSEALFRYEMGFEYKKEQEVKGLRNSYSTFRGLEGARFLIVLFTDKNKPLDSFFIGASLGIVKHLIVIFKKGVLDHRLARLLRKYSKSNEGDLTSLKFIQYLNIEDEISDIEDEVYEYLYDNK